MIYKIKRVIYLQISIKNKMLFQLISLLFIGKVIANKPLESMDIYLCYFDNQSILDSNPENICKEIYKFKNNWTCYQCTTSNKNEFDQTIFSFMPRKNATVVNPVFLNLYTVNPVTRDDSLQDNYHFDTGFYEVRIDKIGSDYLVRQFKTLSSKDKYCELSVILGFETT